MKKILCLITSILFISCSKNDETLKSPNQNLVNFFKYTISLNYGDFHDIYSQEYTFDKSGKVLTETYNNYSNPEYNYKSKFKYNNQGKIIKEIRNNEVFFNVIWEGNVAKVYNSLNEKILDFTLNNENSIENYQTLVNGTIENNKFNYDLNHNIISIEKQNEVSSEYMNYNTNVQNPLSLLKSIGILRIQNNIFFKNFFKTEIIYPYNVYDYCFPYRYYNYQFTLDENNRISSIVEETPVTTITTFEYD